MQASLSAEEVTYDHYAAYKLFEIFPEVRAYVCMLDIIGYRYMDIIISTVFVHVLLYTTGATRNDLLILFFRMMSRLSLNE